MLPSFNTAGPCIPGEHYMLPPERRLGRVMKLIEDRKFFTLRAGRQTGKTTSARWLAQHYNAGEKYRAIWADIETAREQPDPEAAFAAVIEKLDFAVQTWLPGVEPQACARARRSRLARGRGRRGSLDDPRLDEPPRPEVVMARQHAEQLGVDLLLGVEIGRRCLAAHQRLGRLDGPLRLA